MYFELIIFNIPPAIIPPAICNPVDLLVNKVVGHFCNLILI